MSETKTETTEVSRATGGSSPQESIFKPYVPPALGLADCHHCGLAFDLEDVKFKLKLVSQPTCLDCRELPWYQEIEERYLSQYEPPDQF